MASKHSIQFIGTTPEELKKDILKDLRKELQELAEKLKPKPPIIWRSRKEAKDKLGVSYVTLHKWNKNGILKSYKIGGTVRYKDSDIEEKLLTN